MKNIKKWVLDNIVKENGSLNERRMSPLSKKDRRVWAEKHHVSVFNDIMKYNGRSFKENIYMILNDITDIPLCKCCNTQVSLIDNKNGYRIYCSTKCLNSDPDIIKASENTKRKNGSYITKTQRQAKTNMKKYGKNFFVNQEKSKDTLRKNYNVDYPGQSKEIQARIKNTLVERYGVTNPMYNQDSIDKMLQSRGNKVTGSIKAQICKFNNHEVTYQGTYEKIFLESLHKDELIKTSRGPTIKYQFSGKERNYYPDFIIDNVIYEIKSRWTWDNNGTNKLLRIQNKLKLRATKKLGYDVILVIDYKHIPYEEVIRCFI